MSENAEVFKRIIIIFFLLLFLTMIVFNFLTPITCDDYNYSFSYANDERIQSVWDIIPSMAAHRQETNGRIFSHSLVQLFLLLPKAVFNFINSAFTVSVLVLLLRYSNPRLQSTKLFLLCFGVFMFWIFTPDYGQVFLWLDGSCNYSWSMVFTLLFLLPYYDTYISGEKRNPSWWKAVLFFLLSFVSGGYLEGASSAVIFLALCFLILIRVRCKRTPVILLGGVIFAIAGFAQMMTSPAEIGRSTVVSSGMSIDSLLNGVYSVIYMLKNEQIIMYCIWASLLALSVGCHINKQSIMLAVLFMLGGVVSAAVFVFAGGMPGRAAIPITTYTILSCMYLISALLEAGEKKYINLLIGVLAVVFFANFVMGTVDIAKIYGQSRQREAIIAAAKAEGSDTVALADYEQKTKYSGVENLTDIMPNPEDWPNCAMAKYYGIDIILAVN